MHHIDIGRMPDLNEEDKAFVKLMLRMRAIAGATVIGVIALIGITAAPGTAGDASTSVPAASSLSGAPSDAGLMALEHGRLG